MSTLSESSPSSSHPSQPDPSSETTSEELTSAENQPDYQLDAKYYKVDRRYRQSEYFLADQLRYAEAVQDFRSIKNALMNSTQFNLAKVAFHFARAMGKDH